MASEPTGRRAPRITQIVFALAIATILVLLGVGAWLLGTQSGARWAFSTGNSLAAGIFDAQGVEGRLVGPLRIERLTLEFGGTRLVLAPIRLDWVPLDLLHGRLHVTELHAAHLRIVKKIEQNPPPPRMPERIDLPFRLQLDKVQVEGGELGWGALDLIKLGAFAFQVGFDGATYRLALDRFAARSTALAGTLSGQVTLSSVKPFALRGNFSSSGEAQVRGKTVSAQSRLGLDGSLADLAATFETAVEHAQVKGSTRLHPFAEQPLGITDIVAQAFDLSVFDPAWPKTQINAKLSVEPGGAGQLALNNVAAGLPDENKAPLTDLQIAFRQEGGSFRIERIGATLGSARRPAGKVSGEGSYANGALTLGLRIEALDLQRLDRRLRATRLTGRVDLKHAAGKQEWAVALSEPLKKQNITLVARGVLANTDLSIEQAELRAGGGRIDASGRLDLSGRQGFSAQGSVKHFRSRELGDFAQWPELDLTGEFSLKGERQPRLTADLRFKISDSKLAGRALQGEGQVQLHAEQVQVPNLLLVAGDNRLQVQGSLAQGETRLTFVLSAPDLAQLGLGYGGSIDARGEVRGSVARARVTAEWKADKVRAPGPLEIASTHGKAELEIDRGKPFLIDTAVVDGEALGARAAGGSLDRLSVSLRVGTRPDAPLRLALHAQGLLADAWRIDELHAAADGSNSEHSIEISVLEPKQKWKLNAHGGLKKLESAPEWRGSIAAFDGSGRFDAHLAAPAALLLSKQRAQLDGFKVETGAGYFAVEQFARDGAGVTTRGRFEHLQLAQLLRYVEPPPPVNSDLQVGGEWDVRITDRPDISIKLRRESGDVAVSGNAGMALGLSALNASVITSGEKVQLELHAEGRQLGRIEVSVGTRLGGSGARFALAPDAPLAGSARLDIPSLGWVGPLLAPTLITEGRLQSLVTIGGTYGQPRLSGRIGADHLRLLLTDLGVELRNGVLDSEFKGDSLIVGNLAFQSEHGHISASGPINLSNGKVDAQLVLKADHFPLISRADRRIVISGTSQVGWNEGGTKLSGLLTIDSAAIDIGRADTPQLADDVVIVGRERQSAQKKTTTTLDVTITLADDVTLKGRGLDATLAGQLHLSSGAKGQLSAQGNLHVAKGTYTAYGHALAIEQGLLHFSGPLNNPTLDILAMRRRQQQSAQQQQVDAGVSVRGTVLAPRVSLVSEPVVPDAEKLAWLVLGHGLDTTGASDLGALQSAAGALLSQGAASGVQAQIATAFGLDTLSIGASPDNLQSRIVTLGKQISTRLYVSYQQGIDTVSNVVLLRYSLSPRLSLELEAGTRGAFSLFYNITFD